MLKRLGRNILQDAPQFPAFLKMYAAHEDYKGWNFLIAKQKLGTLEKSWC
jgi:hypothetical protein